jgi:hypothetical protein
MSCLPNNLAALSPGIALSLQSAPIPEAFLPTLGTDATPTFCRILNSPGHRKSLQWLGGTSMPRASAAPIINSLDALSSGQNGLGLSIGTGFQWRAFIAKLSRSQMLFVYEPDLSLLRMALEICDLADLLAHRRLILLTGTPDQAAQNLCSFLAENIGFEPPAVLHPLPTLIGERRNQLLTAGEAMVRRAVIQRQSLLSQLESRIIKALPQNSSPHSPEASLNFLLTPRYALERPLHQNLSTPASQIFIDQHHSASPALRLDLIAQHLERGANIRVQSDLFRAHLGSFPPQIAVNTWLSPLVGAAFWEQISPIPPHDRVIVHFGYHAQRLQDRGIPSAQIHVVPLTPPASPAVTAGLLPTQLQLRHRIALIADLSPIDKQSLAIELPTHQAVFAAAREMILADYLTIHPGMAADLLRRALTRAGVDPKVDDPALQYPMLRILRDLLIPCLPVLHLAQELAATCALALIGDWPDFPAQPKSDVRKISFESYSGSAWEDVALVAHLSPQGTFSPILWEALPAGVPIVAPQHSADRHAGSLAKLLEPDVHFAHPAAHHFISTLKSLLRDGPRREKIAQAARNR